MKNYVIKNNRTQSGYQIQPPKYLPHLSLQFKG
jgi:hypothetical protein